MMKQAHVVRVRDNLHGGHTDQTVDLTPEEVDLLSQVGWRLRLQSDWDVEMFVLSHRRVGEGEEQEWRADGRLVR